MYGVINRWMNLTDLNEKGLSCQYLGSQFDYVMNDTAGNTERLVFIYRKSKVKTRKMQYSKSAGTQSAMKSLRTRSEYRGLTAT